VRRRNRDVTTHGRRLVALRVDVHGQLDEAVGVAPLVVIPRHELDEGRGEADAGARALICDRDMPCYISYDMRAKPKDALVRLLLPHQR